MRSGKSKMQRRVLVERRLVGTRKWRLSDRGLTGKRGGFTAQLLPGGIGTWRFRVLAKPVPGARKARRAMRTITVPTPDSTTAGVLWGSVAAGSEQTCALDNRGTAYCWGDGRSGALGNGGTGTVYAPLPVATSGVLGGRVLSSITTGSSHTCALDSAGLAYCWGEGRAGQLGDGAGRSRKAATVVSMPRGATFTSLSAGEEHTCAVSDDSRVYCWGRGGSGQLGTGDSDDALKPVEASFGGKISVRSVAAGGKHTCIVATSGSVLCWGDGSSGQLGDGRSRDSKVPVEVDDTSSFVAVAAGTDFTCGRTLAEVKCWGGGSRGQLGLGRVLDQALPEAIPDLAPTDLLTAGGRTACARLADTGEATCWGANEYGQLGDGLTTDALVPVPVLLPGVAVTSLSAGLSHTCATAADGKAYCWGRGTEGQLGVDASWPSSPPVPVAAPIR